jgi:Zn-dependent M28 family amino/carboxypeptidase
MRRLASTIALFAALSACGGAGAGPGGESGVGEGETDADRTETAGGETGEPLAPVCEFALDERIDPEALSAHLQALAEIAEQNGGNRAAGSSGYEASAAYVEEQLAGLGYEVSRWAFEFDRFVELSPSQLELSLDAPPPQLDADFATATWSPSGSVSAPLDAVDLELGLGNSSTSGCQAEDFADFDPGSVALIQRGGCTFATKAGHAEAAGALAVLIFNQGDSEGRTGLFGGTLGGGNELQIPVLFTTYALGESLAAEVELGPVIADIFVDSDRVPTQTFNVLAQTPGESGRVVMFGAHLDSVPAGPGVNDNGSGSATVLELARQFAACSPRHQVRFAWWGGEEWGLHGSRQWVESLEPGELERLALYLNFDMLASPNYVRYVHSGVGGPAGSVEIHDAFVGYFDTLGLPTAPTPFAGNSDYQAFVDAGVPAGGLATGAGGSKSQDQAETFGGMAGEAYDACYHQACDDAENFAAEVLTQNARAAAHLLQRWAGELDELDAAMPAAPAPVADELAAAAIHGCGHSHE